jgi:hypothetical protein
MSGLGYFVIDGKSASLSWCRAPIWGPWQIFITVGHLRSSCWVAPSLTRWGVCNLLVQFAVPLWTKSWRTHDYILLSHTRLPQPGGPGPCIYIPQEQGGPVIPPGTGLPSCHLLWLSGLRWRYSNPPPHRPEGTKVCRHSWHPTQRDNINCEVFQKTIFKTASVSGTIVSWSA